MLKIPIFKKVMRFKENGFRKVNIIFVYHINRLPDELATTILLSSYGLLKEYSDIPTLNEWQL